MDEKAVPRGRPRLGCRVRHYRWTLTLHEGEDDELIEILDGIPKRRRAMALKAMILSGGMQHNRISYNKIENIDETVDQLVF